MARKKQPQNLWSKIIYLFIMLAGFICANCYLSDLITSNINRGFNFPPNDFVTLSYVKNTGAAFSILQNYPLLLEILAVLALVFLLAYVIRHAGTMSYTGITWLTVLMSGIFCNLFERMTLGYVRDYFYFKFVEFPIFNISDIAINVSIVAIIYLLLIRAQLKQL